MFVSEAPCAQAITLIPLLPNELNSFPAMPGVCFIFSPTTATVARFFSAVILVISPISISFSNALFNTATAKSASSLFNANVVLCSEEACDTRNTLIPFCAKHWKIRELIPITPTIPSPDTVTNDVSLIEEIPLMARESSCTTSLEIFVPGAAELNVFFIMIGIFL